jgi:hypothetical protein
VPLSDDQKAMLRVLAQREEGYEDMAALMGISVEELRGRVKEALADVEDEKAGDELASEPAPPVAAPPADKPAESVAAPVPPTPAAPAPAKPPKRRPQRLSNLKLPKDRGALYGLVAGLLAIVGMAIALIVAGGGGSGSTSSAEGENASLVEAVSRNPNLTDAILTPAPGGEGEGVAIFGRVKKAVVLEVAAKGLESSEPGQSYAIWLSHAGKAMVPMGTAKVPSSGELGARLEVPPAVLVLVARRAFTQVDVTRVVDSRLKAAVATARRQKAESTYTGAPVLSGKINGPLISAAGKSGSQ